MYTKLNIFFQIKQGKILIGYKPTLYYWLKPKHDLVVTLDTDEDQDTMNSDDATAKTNIELDHNYGLQPSQFPHPQPLPIITNLQIFHTPELLLLRIAAH